MRSWAKGTETSESGCRPYSGHSLRRGFLTSATESKANLLKLLEQSRHRRVGSVRGYIAKADRFDDHAGEALLREPNPAVVRR